MRETIREKYEDLKEDLYTNYNKVKVIDNYDFYQSNPYTIFYLNKNEDFNKFEYEWKKYVENGREHDYNYDDILWTFEKDMKDIFDYMELGTIDIYTDNVYELEI